MATLDEQDFPTESERKRVAKRVSRRLDRIAILREEIAQLTRENTKDRFYIATHRLLPREVLGEVFLHAAIQCSGTWLAPVVISHVSRHWRDVINSTPRAWSHICIRIIPNSSYSQIVKTWLELSGHSPLHLRFETPHWGTGTSLGSYLALLQPHVSRWYSVEIFIGEAPHHTIWNIQLLLQQFNFDMPALRSFYLDTTRQLWQDYRVLGGVVPMLKHLNIGHCRPGLTNHWLSHLEALEITHAIHSLYYMHGLLQACPLLTSLKLDVVIQEREMRGWSVVELPKLRNLFLNDIIYLSFLRLPNLSSFTFSKKPVTCLQEGHKLFSSLSIMLEMSHNTIFQDLSLVDVDISRFNITTTDFPSFSNLHLTRCTIRPDALTHHDQTSVWASLNTLEFNSCDQIPDALIDLFIEDNTWVGSLRRLSFSDCFGVGPDLVARVLACKMCPQVAYSASTRTSPRQITSARSGPSNRLPVFFPAPTPVTLPPPPLPRTSS
ncbi:hypothetical protein P691DRAFT_771420 [Macrolepiota fuliginosa MF-IS2]|uniref:F-box domain-containing protein n=1 Tax=Macrolepiota fuliginosa MF-IS2 TaxID=1400762 RepID=A0A9P6C9R5_9AGAR|nr:hypothetical protein P691DRAFT_771420 [Macrolepiota fuliginosa MF-IS2]